MALLPQRSLSPMAASLAVSVPPFLALLYATSVHVFLAAFRERRWASRLRPLLVRSFLSGAAAAFADTLVGRRGTGSHRKMALMSPISGALSIAVSTWLVLRTRMEEIDGPRPEIEEGCMERRVALITGANAGIGRETARQLLAAGATVIMACRSESRAREAMEDILSSLTCPSPSSKPSAHQKFGTEKVALNDVTKQFGKQEQNPRSRLLFLKLDLSDMSSVRSAVATFSEMGLPLSILINNAGIMMKDRVASVDCFELTMAANHLGHFLLTNLLLPHLRREPDARVVVVSSHLHSVPKGGIDLEDLNCERKPYSLFGQYAQTKLANVLFGRELAKREKSVACYIVHPGIVRTDVVRNMPWYLYYPNKIFGRVVASMQKTPEVGAYTSVNCATSSRLVGQSGQYFVNCSPEPLEAHARDDKAASRLWTLSEELVGLTSELPNI